MLTEKCRQDIGHFCDWPSTENDKKCQQTGNIIYLDGLRHSKDKAQYKRLIQKMSNEEIIAESISLNRKLKHKVVDQNLVIKCEQILKEISSRLDFPINSFQNNLEDLALFDN